jgi:hypothetical protein
MQSRLHTKAKKNIKIFRAQATCNTIVQKKTKKNLIKQRRTLLQLSLLRLKVIN